MKAQYAYDAAAPGELTVAEDDLLHTFGPEEDGWLLVQARGKDGAGYVPANYVEEVRRRSSSGSSRIHCAGWTSGADVVV